jgi:hypothetical protein
MPFEYTVLGLLVVGGMLITVGAAWGPETKDVDFSADARATATKVSREGADSSSER